MASIIGGSIGTVAKPEAHLDELENRWRNEIAHTMAVLWSAKILKFVVT